MKTNRLCARLAVLGLLSGTLTCAAPGITIRLVNSAKVPNGIVSIGVQGAGRVLAQAGIDVIWLDCSAGEVGPCGTQPGPGEFWLHVANWKPASATPQELGFTVLDRDSDTEVSLGGIHYPMVRQMASNNGVDEASILAAALAHEIGHLLGEGHSPTGVMCAHFTRQRIVEMSQGGFFFAREQAARMRATIVRRANATRKP